MKERDGWAYLPIIGGGAMASMAIAAALLLAQLLHSSSAHLSGVAMGFVCLALALEMSILIFGQREMHSRAGLLETARVAKAQTDELFMMTEMLQSADDYDDATAVLMATSLRLLPDLGGALYIFNNSRDRLDLARSWNMPAEYHPAEMLAPNNCWALKRGKRHFNDAATGTLCCAHHPGGAAAMEVPMMARGAVYGLLTFATNAADPSAALSQVRRLGQALADSMSLALSNIALREKLRTQSLRDPLTGLYNRRYMEDALERYISLAARTGAATAVLMIDLDNFKQLNDQHGHTKGDAVLRDVASRLIGGLRPSDVVCRYGGEELMVILPNCSLDDAQIKAEELRARIAGLSDVHNAPVSASFGAAAIPETSVSQADLVAMADAALYRAKNSGRNCVVCADRRALKDDHKLRVAVTG